MSPCERNAWIRLVSILLVFAPYFGLVALLFADGGALARPIYVAFVVAAVLFGLVNAVVQVAADIVFGRAIADERDRAIEALSLRVAYFALIALLLGALSTFAAIGILTAPSTAGLIPAPGFVATSQFVFSSVVVTELARHVVQVVCYRGGVRS